MRRADRLLIVSVVGLGIYLAVGSLYPESGSPLAALYNAFLGVSTVLGYPGAFIISFLGNATILFPFPYMAIVFILGGVTVSPAVYLFDPWMIGIVSGFGAMLGELVGYLIGYGGGNFIAQDKKNGFREFIGSHPRATPIVLWFLAATPIPDDVLIVPLGVTRYPWWKVAVPQLIGKTMFMMVVAWAGRFGLEFVEDLFGGTNPLSFSSRVIEVAALFLVIFAIYLLVRIDWRAFFTKNPSTDDM